MTAEAVEPFRIKCTSQCIVGNDVLKRNAATNAHHPRQVTLLAVVGGGPLVVNDLDELRSWPGHIWAVNHTASWLAERGIKSTFVSIDPQPWPDGPIAHGVDDCLIASCCDPSLFERLAGKNIETFDLVETHEDGITGGITTALRMPSLALRRGYRDIQFFGCEGSYLPGADHVNGHAGHAHEMIIRAGGNDYLTNAEFLGQCENFAELFRVMPLFLKNRSGGLLAAMCQNPDWECVGVSASLKAHLEATNGAQGLFDEPYRKAA